MQGLVEHIGTELYADEFWGSYLQEKVLAYPPSVSTHLAVFVEPYLQYILDGKKTVESRFSVRHTPPYGIVRDGDVVVLKRVAGPVLGVCRVVNTWDYELNPESFTELRAEFAAALCAQDPEFWAVRAGASYATLMRLGNVCQLRPLHVKKSDRRGWVVLKRRTNQLLLWEE